MAGGRLSRLVSRVDTGTRVMAEDLWIQDRGSEAGLLTPSSQPTLQVNVAWLRIPNLHLTPSKGPMPTYSQGNSEPNLTFSLQSPSPSVSSPSQSQGKCHPGTSHLLQYPLGIPSFLHATPNEFPAGFLPRLVPHSGPALALNSMMTSLPSLLEKAKAPPPCLAETPPLR